MNLVGAIISVVVNSTQSTVIIAKLISEISNVFSIYEVSGNSDIIVILNAPNMSELNKSIDCIRALNNIQDTNSMIVLNETTIER